MTVTLGHGRALSAPTLVGVLDIPRSARLAAWGTAYLRGEVSTATVVERVQDKDEPHRVEPADVLGLDAVDLAGLLTALRAAGGTGLRVVLPVPGDVLGLPGPAAFNAAAVEAGECVIVLGSPAWGAVPEVTGFGSALEPGWMVTWQVLPVTERPAATGTLAEAEQALREGMAEATSALTRLDVASWRPGTGERLHLLRRAELHPGVMPAGTDQRSLRVLAGAHRLRAVLALAGEDDGAGVTAFEVQQRAEALRGLDGVCRRAVAAAVNAAVERSL